MIKNKILKPTNLKTNYIITHLSILFQQYKKYLPIHIISKIFHTQNLTIHKNLQTYVTSLEIKKNKSIISIHNFFIPFTFYKIPIYSINYHILISKTYS